MGNDTFDPVENERIFVLYLGTWGCTNQDKALRNRSDHEYYNVLQEYLTTNRTRNDEVGRTGKAYAREKLLELKDRVKVIIV